MIRVEGLSFRYPQAACPILNKVDLEIPTGELVLVVGPSGGGKSTFLRSLNGLVPHFHGGTYSGRVLVAGRSTVDNQPRDLAGTVGMVFQDPESQVVAETVEDELTFGMETAGLQQATMRKRVEEVLDVMGIAQLRNRRLDTLSGGELQRVAIGAVLTMQPRVLLLDEPTSQLDPQAAEDLLTAVQRLNDDLGLTVVVAEHRLERVIQYSSRVMYIPGDGSVIAMETRQAMESLSLAPPVVRLGRGLGWSPLPLSVREARTFAPSFSQNGMHKEQGTRSREQDEEVGSRNQDVSAPAIAVQELQVSYGEFEALRGVSLEVPAGEIVALMGRNGAGKTTLLRTLIGLERPVRGSASVLGIDVTSAETETLARDIALVPQAPDAVLYRQTVEEEIAETLEASSRTGEVDATLREWGLEDLRSANPADLSVGERQRTALAAMLVGAPRVVLLDEPTRGMDYETKEQLVVNLKRRAQAGCAVVIASHDVELAAQCAYRVVLLSEGELAVDGPTREVLTESLTFSTQVNRLFGGRYLTPEDVLGEGVLT